MRTLNLILMIALFFSACQNAGTNGETAEGEEGAAMEDTTAMAYELAPFPQSPAYSDAAIESMEFQNGQFNFEISNYELGVQTPDAPQKMCANSDQGQHIHVIVDKEPYTAHYTPNFEYEIEDGEHYLLAFLSRSYHESVKNPNARVAQKVMIENNSITSREDITGPILFYSRPKGTYVGRDQTENVLLDFYVLNVGLGDQYKVKADINGEAHMIDTWQPFFIKGLPMGDNTITLTLVDADGNAVDAPLNPVTRTITLQEDPAEEM